MAESRFCIFTPLVYVVQITLCGADDKKH